MELFHPIAPKCPGDVGNSHNMRADPPPYCICMGACLVYGCEYITSPRITRPGIFIHPPETQATTTKKKEPLHRPPFLLPPAPASPPSKASMVSGRQVILLPVQIMTAIKQLRPQREGGKGVGWEGGWLKSRLFLHNLTNEDSPGNTNIIATAYASSLWC